MKSKSRTTKQSYFIACITLAACLLLISSCIMHKNDIVIVKKSSPKGKIIINPDASDAVRFAAQELQTYLEKISGARVPVKTDVVKVGKNQIFIGQSASNKNLHINTGEL